MQKSKFKNQNGNAKLKNAREAGHRNFAFCIFHFAFARKRGGVALLLAVLILASLLAIGLGIFDVVFGEIRITEELSDSFVALSAADQGIERLLYEDLVADSLAGCGGASPCTYGPVNVDLGNQRCTRLALRRTGSGQTTAESVGEYRCGSERSVKRRLVTLYEKAAPSGFSPDTAGTLESGLVAYWPLEETSGTRADAKGSNHLTDNNIVTSNPGKVGNAGQFLRTDPDYLSIADNADLSTGNIDFTVAAWVYADTSPGAGFNVIASKENQLPNEWTLGWLSSANRFVFRIWNPGDLLLPADSFGVPSINTWYFIVAWHDAAADTINIQVGSGGVLGPIDSIGTGGVGPSDTTASFQIGEIGLGSGNGWNGRIDEFGFWKKVLSAQERTDLWNNGLGNTCAAPCQ